MELGPLSANLVHLFNSEPVRNGIIELAEKDGNFANILTEALETSVETDRLDKGNSLELLMGESDDLSGMLIDMQKAELSLQLTLQIRNKILDAYNEVMRMSV